MTAKNFIKEYLHFTRKERIGVMFLLLILLTIILFPSFLPEKDNSVPISTDTEWTNLMKSLESKSENEYDTEESVASLTYEKSAETFTPPAKGELFFFDPNKLDAAGWKKLGLRDKTIRTIINYTGKGGYFKQPSDLKRIYGLHKNEFERLAPFIRIEEEKRNFKKFETNPKSTESVFKPIKEKTNRYAAVDINKANLDDFVSLPGIGEKLGTRIITFRDKLGGFHSVEQVAETYGLPDSTYQKIQTLLLVQETNIKKIPINQSSKDELKMHPYIKWKIANAIVEYRNQHGPFKSLEDLKKIILLDHETFLKIQPYLIVD